MHIITGMHRSGTSFVAQALSWLGGDFGDPRLFFQADKWNKEGYFESLPIIDVNNRAILGEPARLEYWTSPNGGLLGGISNFIRSRRWKYFLFPRLSSIERRLDGAEVQIRQLHQLYKGKYVKDPRFCLTLRGWQRYGPVEGLIFPFRSPEAVARSLRRRDGLPRTLGYRYWLYHVGSFIEQAPGDRKILFVDFDEFFDAQAQTSAFGCLRDYMGLSDDDARAATLVEILKVKLRTQSSSSSRAPRRIQEAYEALKSLREAGDGGPVRLSDYPELRQRALGK